MQKKITTYQRLKSLTHKFVDIGNNGEYEVICKKFEILLVELANDLLSKPDKYGYGYYAKNNYLRYLRILASNMGEHERLGTVKRFKEFLDSLEINARVHLLKYLGDFLIIMAYGRNTQFFSDLDKTLERSNGKDKTQKDQRHYPYIAYDTNGFISVLSTIHEKFEKRKSFIDVGCGIGDKVLLAWLSGIFEECIGIEYEGFTSLIGERVAQNRLSSFRPQLDIKDGAIRSRAGYKHNSVPIDFGIVNGDAFDINYKRFDTIYLYHPIADQNCMSLLYQHIFKTLPKKAILLEMMQDNGLKDAVEVINQERFRLPSGRNSRTYYYKTTTNKLRVRNF